MKLLVLLFSASIPLILGKDYISDIIQNAGYRSSFHRVTTKDGFILGLHRMNQRARSRTRHANPILLMHGIVQSAAVWVYDGPGRSLAMLLSDAGYDVWMLSARGTTVSSQHRNLSPEEENYWDFSFHDIATKDLPATVDYILRKTGHESLHYVGHSQGGTVFVAFMAFLPEYNAKIRSSYLLAPATFMQNVQGVFTGILDFLFEHKLEVAEAMRNAKFYALKLRQPFITEMLPSICVNNFLCNLVRDVILGPSSAQLDDRMSTHDMMKYTFDNIAIKQLFHFIQLIYTDKFQLYDMVPNNRDFYGSDKIPEYNLTNLNIPLTVFYGTKDVLVNATDVEKFLSLPHIKGILKGAKKLPWAHMDFVSGRDAPQEIHQYILRQLRFYRK
ncbi:lipase 3-like [Culicoides brevitarsis]|uniref:lipase 3-like n=1 Tax=Culicoides brevitarsis TaxID=469753 RepID=UPI00307BA9C0